MKVTQRTGAHTTVYCNVTDLKWHSPSICYGKGVSNRTDHSNPVKFSLDAAAGPIEIEE